MKLYDITGLGFCSVDMISEVDKYPEADDKVKGNSFDFQLGGPSAVATVTNSRLGLKTAFIGTIGSDYFGDVVLEKLRTYGVEYRSVKSVEGVDTRVALCIVERNSGTRTVVWNGSDYNRRLTDMDIELIKSSKMLILDGHEMETALEAVRYAREAGTKIMIDAGSYKDRLEVLLGYADYVIASSKYFSEHLHIDAGSKVDVKKGLEELLSFGPGLAGITLGPRGSYISARDIDMNFVPAVPVKDVVDSTGCGDVFHGAFCYGVLNGMKVTECQKFATYCAAFKCGFRGGPAGIPDIETAMKGYREML